MQGTKSEVVIVLASFFCRTPVRLRDPSVNCRIMGGGIGDVSACRPNVSSESPTSDRNHSALSVENAMSIPECPYRAYAKDKKWVCRWGLTSAIEDISIGQCS